MTMLVRQIAAKFRMWRMSLGVMSLGEIVGRLSVICAAEISGNAITIVLNAAGPPRASVIEAKAVGR